jgi:hypothetical protein
VILTVGSAFQSDRQPSLGVGLVLSVESHKARVFFPRHGQKAFQPELAALRVVDASDEEEALFSVLRCLETWASDPRLHHRVYVIELGADVRGDFAFRSRNPDIRSDLDCLYVGGTGLAPEERFDNHRAGHKSSWYVTQFGLRLRPDLYEQFPAVRWDQVPFLESTYAALLRSWGYRVWQKRTDANRRFNTAQPELEHGRSRSRTGSARKP